MTKETNEIISLALVRLRAASTHLSSVVYNTRDDDDDLDLLKSGCKIGQAWELINSVHYQFKQSMLSEIDIETVNYDLKNMMGQCENMVKNARTDADDVDTLKLGYYVGMVYQELHRLIESLQTNLASNIIDKPTDELIAEAQPVPNQDIFRYAVAQETIE